jgi:hypothetical protein
MSLKLVTVSVNRDSHPNRVFATLQNDKTETISVQIHIDVSQNVDRLTLGEIEKLAHEAAKQLPL